MGYRFLGPDGLTDAQLKVLQALKVLGPSSPSQLLKSGLLGIGQAMLHRHLIRLLELKLIQKVGIAPKVYYQVLREQKESQREEIYVDDWIPSPAQGQTLQKFFAVESSAGLIHGKEAFCQWFKNKQLASLLKSRSKSLSLKDQILQNIGVLANRFFDVRQEVEVSRDNTTGLINGTERYKNIFEPALLNHVWYCDFYALPQFGKTESGLLVQKAKVGDPKCMPFVLELASRLESTLQLLQCVQNFDAFVWVPHSLPRSVGLQDVLAKKVMLNVPRIQVSKIFQDSVIPQKSLADLNLRIQNATLTNHISASSQSLRRHQKILIIDDAIGSNATAHCIAQKLRIILPNAYICALGIVGSYKGFEAIRDV